MSETQRSDAPDPEDEPARESEPEKAAIAKDEGPDQTAGDAKSDDAKSDDAKSDDAKSDDAKSDDAKSDDAPAKPTRTKRERREKTEKKAEKEPDPEAEEEEPLLPLGNPLRPLRGGIAIAVGAFVAFCLMAVAPQYRFGVPLVALAVFVAAFGVLDLAGSFDDPDTRVARRATLSELARPLALFLGGAISFFASITLAVDGRLSSSAPVLTAGIVIPASFLVTIVGLYRAGEALGVFTDEHGVTLPLARRHGFWLLTLGTLLYLPTLGSHSLSDPWETHYGEVAREILARNDWISTWWAQDGWFWSKPILDFWIQALAMATFGVRYRSDQVLSAVREGRVPWPEWSVRLPVFLLTILAVYLLYKAVARVFGRRAGLFGGVVLLTMPQWFLLGHQTMTDMPFVAPLASAMALLLLGAHEDPEAQVRVYELAIGPLKLRLSAFHLVMGAIAACAIPQILYLVSRNVSLDIRLFHFHPDAFTSGSPGNCGLPSNDGCRAALPVVRGLHPALQALIWAQALALIVYINWGERRRQRLYFLAAWLFAALSTMAKGPAGFILPVLCVLAYVAVSRRWRDLLRIEIASGVLILLAVALPWFVAMYVRHGQPFTDRLLFHDMFKRAFTHVHDTNEGDDVSFRFYIWQLGYAMFPWTGLVPAALTFWLRRREEGDRKSDASAFLAMWFVFAFALFSAMLTKFHHYILPAVPPAAMLTGVLLDDLLDRALDAKDHRERARSFTDIAIYAVGIVSGLTGVLWGASRVFAPFSGSSTLARGPLLSVSGLAVLVLGAAVLGAIVITIGARVTAPAGPAEPADAPVEDDTEAFRARFERVQLGAAGIAGAALVLAVGRDLSATYEGMPNQIRLMHLITYNYRRPWPPSLDFTGTLWAFTAVAALLTFALVVARARRHVTYGLIALGILFGVWGLDVYFMKISPHWGQRETTLAYYQAQRERPGQLIAYQMNWKGENYYTGNRVPAFVSSGKRFQDYILEEKKKGQRTFYFVTEHGRTTTLSNELGQTREFEKLTPPELNNKFVLVRVKFD